MKTFKKMTYLFMIAVLLSCNTEAQQVTANSKISITNFKVYENDSQLIIDWATDGTVSTNYWELQRSADGEKFSTFALVFGPDPKQKGDAYQYKGKIKNSKGNKIYYRLCPVGSDGKEINSEIIQSAK